MPNPNPQPGRLQEPCPHLRVLRGRPGDEQLAALAAVLVALRRPRPAGADIADQAPPLRMTWRHQPDDPSASSWSRQPAS